MDMTPMIDVVFNLIIFFMLVTQMVTIERAELELPIADQAKEERTVDTKNLILNVHKDSRVEVAGQIISWAELVKLLYEESRVSANPQGISNRSILIRADIDTPYKTIQQVMLECAKKKIYKVSFSAKIESER